MAEAAVLKEFLVVLGARVDESAQRRFIDAITSMTNTVLGLGAGVVGAVGAVTAAVANMASSGAQMAYFAQNLGETVSNVDAIVYAWQRLGLAPQATMTALQNLAHMMRNEPGLAGLWNEKAGPGSLTQQFEHMGDKFAQMNAQEQRMFSANFEKFIGTDVLNAWRARAGQVGGGVGEFNIVKQLFHFDPDDFSRQSVQFERAWGSFHLRLNDIGGHVATPILTQMTVSLREMNTWLDAHSAEITKKLDDIGKAIKEAFLGGVDLVRDITGWFQKLSPAGREAAEAIGLIGLAFLKPGWLKIGAIAYVLETLLRDYEAFKKTGHSDLGIPWGHIGEQIDNIAKATNGWLSPLHAIEAYFGVRLLLSATRFFSAIAIGSAAAGSALTTGLGGALTRLLALIPKAGPLAFLLGAGAAGGEDQAFSARKNEEFKQTHPGGFLDGLIPDPVRRWWGSHAPGLPGGLPADRMPQQGGSAGGGNWLSSLWHMLIPQAEAAEMPANIKALSMNVAKLNDTISDATEAGGLMGGWGAGLGGSIVSGLFGGGGAQGPGKGIDSPEAIEAVKYFMAKGWTLPQAIGIVANLVQESGLSPTAVDATGHVGVAQWDQQRQQAFRLSHGKPITSASREEQYKFVDEELRASQARAGFELRQATTFEQAAMAVDRFYERSAGTEIGRRIANAGALGRDPRLQGDSFRAGNTVTQHNNVTINTTADPNAIRSALDLQHQRQLADLQRNQQGALH